MNDFSSQRTNMVNSQVATNKVTDRRLLAAMLDVPRELFIPASAQAFAYIDDDVPFSSDKESNDRFLMEPMPFARLVQAASIARDDLVLDIGCGTGYSAAVLGKLADSVIALESDAKMSKTAASVLAELDVDNAAVITGPLCKGYADEAPYDVIILEGAVEEIPDALFKQLGDSGRLAAVVVENGVGRARLYTRHGKSVSERTLFDANIQPLPGFARTPSFVF